MISEKKIFYINSENRLSGTNSNFTFRIDTKNNDDFDYVVLLQASIPKSYYLISEGSNTFILNETGNDTIITLPNGNYSRSSYRAQLETSLNAGSPNGWTYTVTIPNSSQTGETGHYTFNVANNGGIQPYFAFVENSIHEASGFQPNSINYFVGDQLISSDVVKLQREDALFIHSDMCSNGSDDILQEIYTFDSIDFSNIVFINQDVEAYSKLITNKNSHVFRFYLTDDFSNEINLNGQNMNFTIMLYKKDDTLKLIRDFIKIKLLEEE